MPRRTDTLRRAETLRRPAPSRRSHHADRRCHQRAIGQDAIDAALDWGDEYRQAHGRRAYFLGDRAVGRAARAGEELSRYAGTAVVLAPDGVVVTAIRCSDPRRLRGR